MTALAKGDSVGAYVLVRPERADAEESVWLARTATMPPTPVTIRVRPRPGAGSAFGQEVVLGRWLQHPNLMVALEEAEVGPWSCAIAPGMPCVPLTALLPALAATRERDELAWMVMVAHVVDALAAGLDFAHRQVGAPGNPRGIVHGAVRPAVVQIAADGVVRLAGFGASVDDDPSRVAERSLEALAYAAPEQFGTRSKTATMDLWATGAVLHELLDGRAFRGELTDPRALYQVALRGDVPALTRPAPSALDQVRRALLATLPRERPQSCAQLRGLLQSIARPVEAAAAFAALVRAHAAGEAPSEAAAPALGVQPPMSPMMSPPMMSPPSMPPPALPYGQPSPPPMAPFVPAPPMGLDLPEDEGTVQLDENMLAAMRAGTAPPPSSLAPMPASSAPPRDLQMPPPAARSSSGASRSVAPAPARPAPVPVMAPMPHAPRPAPSVAAPPRVVEARHDPGPLDLHPSYEPTTTTTLRARRSSRMFVVLLVVAGVVAIGVGIGVGYLIVGDAPAPAPKKPSPTKADDRPPKDR